MSLSPRQELLEIQKKIYKHNSRLIDASIIVKEPDFEKYESAYRKHVKNYKRVASQEEMIDDILKSDIVYVGDYHTCNQSQRSFLRILKSVVRNLKSTQNQEIEIIIGLEFDIEDT